MAKAARASSIRRHALIGSWVTPPTTGAIEIERGGDENITINHGYDGDGQHNDGDGRHDDGKGGARGSRVSGGTTTLTGGRRHDDGKGQQGDMRHDDGDGRHDEWSSARSQSVVTRMAIKILIMKIYSRFKGTDLSRSMLANFVMPQRRDRGAMAAMGRRRPPWSW